MCDFDNLDPIDIAFIAGLAETLLQGDEEQEVPKEPSSADLLEYYDAVSDNNEDEPEL